MSGNYQFVGTAVCIHCGKSPEAATIADGKLSELMLCANAWEPSVCLLGNVTAGDLRLLCAELAQLRTRAVTPEERAVLDACAEWETPVLEHIRDGWSAAPPVWHSAAKAELARRTSKESR